MKIWYASHGEGPGLHLEITPLWFYLLAQLAERICWPLHRIPLPNWPRCFGDKEGNGGQYYTPREYYGDLGCIWDVRILNGVINKLYFKYVKSVWLPLTETQVKNHPCHDDRIWWMQCQQRHLEYKAEEAREFMESDTRTCGCRGILYQVCDICQKATEDDRDKDQSEISGTDTSGTTACSE